MLMPSIFGESLLDDFMDDFAFPYTGTRTYGKQAVNLMRTDVKDTPSAYELEIELPGVKKEDVKAELKDGYLTITASTDSKKEEKQENGSYIRRERYAGTCSRSFYVGDGMKQEDIKAKFENGVLKVTVPKKEEKPVVENNSYITIEGYPPLCVKDRRTGMRAGDRVPVC